MIIWKDTPVLIKHKCWCWKKPGKNPQFSFTVDLGSMPTGQINEITGRFEECVNNRGLAYAARNRLKHRKNRKKYNIGV